MNNINVSSKNRLFCVNFQTETGKVVSFVIDEENLKNLNAVRDGKEKLTTWANGKTFCTVVKLEHGIKF